MRGLNPEDIDQLIPEMTEGENSRWYDICRVGVAL